MEKKLYQTPSTEQIHMAPALNLLGQSIDKGIDNGEGEADAKNIDFFEDEASEVGGRFKIWDD